MELKVYTKDDPILRQPTEEVTDFDMELQNLIDNMIETMRNNNGIGISAPQVGVSKKIIAGEFEGEKKYKSDGFPLTVICNPIIKKTSRDKRKMVEGCLSFPGLEIIVQRPKKVEIIGNDRYGNPITINDDKLLSRVMQHEIDHLISTLLIDHLEKISVVFFGTGSFGLKSLKMLARDPQYKISAIITSDLKPILRHGKSVEQNVIRQTAKKFKLPIIAVNNLNNEKIITEIKKLKPDIGIMSDFGFIIPKQIIDIPKYGILNIHPSLLPEFRGPTPIQTAILSGANKTGISIMLINQKIDDGPIVAKVRVKLHQNENYRILSEYLSEIASTLLLNTIPYYITGELKPKKQNIKKIAYTKIINKEDGEVTSKDKQIDVERKIRAFSEWPKVYINIKGKRVQLISAHYDRNENLIIDRVKPEGKSEMNYQDFCHGYHTNLTFTK